MNYRTQNWDLQSAFPIRWHDVINWIIKTIRSLWMIEHFCVLQVLRGPLWKRRVPPGTSAITLSRSMTKRQVSWKKMAKPLQVRFFFMFFKYVTDGLISASSWSNFDWLRKFLLARFYVLQGVVTNRHGILRPFKTMIPNCSLAHSERREKRKKSDSLLLQKPLHSRKIEKATWKHKTPPKTSITQWLRTDLGRSVGVTTATQLV